MADISVLVATRNPGSDLPGFVWSIDSQTLRASEFELVVVDASGDGSTARLEHLAGRRPNVTVSAADPGRSEADRLGLAVARASGEYVLVVSQQQRLAPRALELLLDQARRTGADLVLGRAVTGAASGCAVLPDDADRIDTAAIDGAGSDPTQLVWAVRRSLLAGRADAGAALLDLRTLAAGAGTVSAVDRYACAIHDSGRSVSEADVSLGSATFRWVDGMLQVAVTVRLPESGSPAVRVWLVVARGPAEIALPATIGPDERDRPTLTASAVLDPRTAEGGHPLGDGLWDLRLRLTVPGGEVTLPLGVCPTRPAVIDGRPYVLHAADHAVQLDAGAIATSTIGRVPTSRASVAESAHGTLVTLEHPDLHVHGDAVLDARLLLGGFGVPARLVCRDGGARLEAYVGSLAGTSTIAVVAGGGTPVPTGLRLRVDGVGGMVLVEDAPAPKSAPPATSTAVGVPVVQRLRRHLPGALEPLAGRLVEVAVLRRAYQRLISR